MRFWIWGGKGVGARREGLGYEGRVWGGGLGFFGGMVFVFHIEWKELFTQHVCLS